MEAADEDIVRSVERDWDTFSGLGHLTNHWDRAGWWTGRRAYYWYLTFEDEPALRSVAAQCQTALRAPFLDLVPLDDLHMTLERVAFENEIDEQQLLAVESAAVAASVEIEPFTISVGPLAGSSGAISFTASPRAPLAALRDRLDDATKAAFPARGQPESRRFRPHVGIAYSNTTTPSAPVIAAVEQLRGLRPVDIDVRAVSLVVLTREKNAYSWVERRRLPLGSS